MAFEKTVIAPNPTAYPLMRRYATAWPNSAGKAVVWLRRTLLSTAVFTGLVVLSGCQSTADVGVRQSAPVTADATGKTLVLPRLEPTGMSLSGAYLAGRHAMNNRDLGQAAAFLGRALDSDPDNTDLLRQTFLVLLSEGRLDDAEPLGRAMIERDSDGSETATAHLVLAVLELARGDLEKAETMVAGLPERGLNAIVAPLIKAWLIAGRDDLPGALAAMEPLRENAGVTNLTTLHTALIHDAAGKTEEADALFRATLDGQNRLSYRLANMAGAFFERSGKPEDARTLYNRYLELNPDSQVMDPALERLDAGKTPPDAVKEPGRGVAEALFDLASILQQERATDMALIYAQLSAKLDPTLSVANVLIGEIFESQQRFDAAVDAYAKVDESSPFFWSTRLRVAESLNDLDRTDEAIELLTEMGEERAERYDALSQLGDILRRRERFVEAVDAYTQAIDRIDTVEERHWSLFYTSGIAFHRADQWDDAEVSFERALELQPDQPYVLNYLGYSWIEMGRNTARAKRMIEKAVEQRPDDGYIVDSLGWVHYTIGDYEAAVIQLERAVELRPQDPTINDHLGDAYWKVGRYNEARFQWRRALSLDPEEDQISIIEEKIDRGLVEGVANTEQ